jgi:hypothetical protein
MQLANLTSAVRVAISAPSALISFEVDNSILVVVALWWISSLSIAAKRVFHPSSLRCLSLTVLLFSCLFFMLLFVELVAAVREA